MKDFLHVGFRRARAALAFYPPHACSRGKENSLFPFSLSQARHQDGPSCVPVDSRVPVSSRSTAGGGFHGVCPPVRLLLGSGYRDSLLCFGVLLSDSLLLCTVTLTRLPPGTPITRCPFCSAVAKVDFSGRICPVCDLSELGTRVRRLRARGGNASRVLDFLQRFHSPTQRSV